jgi:hypothetical protein
MSSDPDGIVKVKVCDSDIVFSESDQRCLQVSIICMRQNRLIFFGPKQVDSVYNSVLVGQLFEMTFESWLRGLWPCELDTLTKGL